eukprot:TRINITY_DN12754_c0_g1_i1.p1 TRINITY_DN12754_c0_g1~~TRINITY_DN12754_c0_g1_i1.p1  ORF type:complete len:134 (+),score=35.46 TRINITY_DN12754_c0_g1_i1:43-444(+)
MFDESPKVDLKVIILLAGSLALGLLCNLLACFIWKNWLAIIVVIFYFLAPIPNLICSRCGGDPLDASGRNFRDMGFFLTGAIVISGFGLPAVLTHSEIIRWEALLLAIAGGLIVYVTLLVYIHLFHTKKSDDF